MLLDCCPVDYVKALVLFRSSECRMFIFLVCAFAASVNGFFFKLLFSFGLFKKISQAILLRSYLWIFVFPTFDLMLKDNLYP